MKMVVYRLKQLFSTSGNETGGRLLVHCEGNEIKLGKSAHIEVAQNATLEVDGSIDVQVSKISMLDVKVTSLLIVVRT